MGRLFFAQVDEPELYADGISGFEKVIHKIEGYSSRVGKKYDLEWNSTSTIELDEKNMNCGNCANCGQWVTDCEKPGRISDLCNGARIDGKLYCDECLPRGHKWAF